MSVVYIPPTELRYAPRDWGLGAGEQNPYPLYQCTWGVWQYIHDHFGVAMPPLPGNATDWFPDAQQKGWKTTSQPTVDTAVCWSSAKYPPYGHVAFVTAVDNGALANVQSSGTSMTFTVDEYNFPSASNGNKSLAHGTRTIKVGSSEAEGIEGFIEVPGVTPGTQLGTPSDPWSAFTSGLRQVELDAEHQVQSAFHQAIAGGEVILGLTVMAGGVWLVQKSMRDGGPAARSAIAGVPRRLRGRSGATAPSSGETATKPATAKEAVQGAQDAVLGKEAAVEAAVRQKIAAGQLGKLTAAETRWMSANPERVRMAFQVAPTRANLGRVTAAGRTRVLTS